MKYIFFLSAILGITACNGQLQNNRIIPEKSKKKYSEECSKHYLFGTEVIDLEEMKSVPIGGMVNDFKQCSIYASRFENKLGDTILIGETTYYLEIDNKKNGYILVSKSKNGSTGLRVLPVSKPIPEVHEYRGWLAAYGNNVIVLLEDWYDTKYIVCRYGEDENKTIEIENTYITHPEPKTNEYNRYLYFHSFTQSQMIFTSHMAFADKFVTRILDLNTFEIKEYDRMAHGVILDENEAKLAGFVTSKKDYKKEKQPTHFEITMIDGTNYSFDIDYGDEACEFLMKDSLLYIGNYHPISTGSSLHCFDMRTGKMKWKADVLQVNASHSEYWNKVTLSMYKNKIIMQGDEAYGSYLQIFDAESGERLAHFGNVMKD